jgi:hypothetical protein
MHPSILAKRKAQALERIVRAARGLDPEHAEALEPKGVKDPAAAEMMRLEALAEILEGLGPVFEPPAVTAVTPEKPMPVLDTDKPQPEDLPEPVLDEEPAPTKKTRRAKK